MDPHHILYPDDPDPVWRYKREAEQQEEELARERRQVERERQRTTDATTAGWTEWIDGRVDRAIDIMTKVTGEAIGYERKDFHAALAKRDDEIDSLRRQVRALHDEVDLRLKLADELTAARSEIAELQQRAPSFKTELAALQEQVAMQAKLITRLRGQTSGLEFRQKQLDAAQMKSRHEVTMTVAQLTTFGQQTEKILHELYENGFNVVAEMPPVSGSIS
jgi:chromosome segregation ATPase